MAASNDPNPSDGQVADLARYRKAREAAQRQAVKPRSEGLLGPNPRAALILALAALAFGAIWLWPLIQRWL